MFTQDYLLQSLFVKGEVSNCKYHASGHIYFTLKDTKGAINCIMFAGNRVGLSFRLMDGQQVIAGGMVDVYERDGKYQLYAKQIMLDGAGLSSLKGALMARGAREVARLIHAMGGNELSAYGLCHLGDYEATLFSPHSHNRMFGECFIKGQPYTQLAEGASTVKALIRLGQEYGVDLPICHVVDSVLYHNMQPDQALNSLFSRSVKGEFDL